MALSREDVRFGVVPGIARLGEVLANAFNRQQELSMNFELERLKHMAQQAKDGAKKTIEAKTRTEAEAKGLRGQLSSALEAQDKALSPSLEEDAIGREVPDFSMGREQVLKLMPELSTEVVDETGVAKPDPTLTGEGAESLNRITDELSPVFNRYGKLAEQVSTDPRTPVTAGLQAQLDAMLNTGLVDAQSGRTQRVMRSLEVMRLFESSPGLLERIQNLDAPGGAEAAGSGGCVRCGAGQGR